MAGGVERVLTTKANYFADKLDYDVTIILTEGRGKDFFYPLSEKVKVINLDINFEELWYCSFYKKIWLYLRKQPVYKRKLKAALMGIRPDFTVSLLRREINFLTSIKDGSKKIGEMHINRAHFRTEESHNPSIIKVFFAKVWMRALVPKLRQLDQLVVLTENDRESWHELSNVVAIPNPVSIKPSSRSPLAEKRIISIGRYCHEKGYDDLLKTWAELQQLDSDWRLDTFGDGDRSSYEAMIDELQIDRSRCSLHGRTLDVQSEYLNSSIAVCSSNYEGFGLSLVEAMACGLPVVSFDCPWGPRNIITDGEDGLLVENGNTHKLAQALVTLIQHPEEIERMGGNAILNVRRFSIEGVAGRWKQLFDNLINQ
jgi:glycosyltransferase involved in cell wall biosynthesis